MVRVAMKVTQAAAADAMAVSQPRIAEIEGVALLAANPKLATLAAYVKALGGELEVRARFGEQSYRLEGPPQKLPPPVPIEVSAEFQVDVERMIDADDAG